MTAPTLIDLTLLDDLGVKARASIRRRTHHNFHPHNDFPCHRMLVAIMPDSYVPPHRHLDPNKAETLVVLRGRLGLVCFEADGTPSRHCVLAAGGELSGVDLPSGLFHTVLALDDDTVFMEAKAGPYVPLGADERAAWAPAEGDIKAQAYLAGLHKLFA